MVAGRSVDSKSSRTSSSTSRTPTPAHRRDSLRRRTEMGDRMLHGAKPGAPYATAVSRDRLLFVSGAVALDEHGEIPTGIEAQTKQVLANLSRVVRDAGGDIA